MADVVFVGQRARIHELALQLAAMLAGRAPDQFGIAEGFLYSIGLAALADIREAFEIKSKGGTDAMGITWQPLSPRTIANRRVGHRDKKDPAIALREKIRKREERKLLKRLMVSLPESEARQKAKALAQAAATRITGRTKIDVLGHRKVEILRDTGILFNSLGPGRFVRTGDSVRYIKPTGNGGEQQLFELEPGAVIVGTNVRYAATHQYGSEHVPARPFLPPRESSIPQQWWDNWTDAGQAAIAAGFRLLVESESGK